MAEVEWEKRREDEDRSKEGGRQVPGKRKVGQREEAEVPGKRRAGQKEEAGKADSKTLVSCCEDYAF